MFWFQKKNQEKEFRTLIVGLKRVEKSQLTKVQKNSMRERLLFAVENKHDSDLVPKSLRTLDQSIARIVRSSVLPASVAASLKERLIDAIEMKPLALAFHKRHLNLLLTSFLLVAFTATSVVVPFHAPTVQARAFVEDVSGEVYVKRAGRLIKVQASFLLQQGDRLITQASSSVSVRFFDESLGRLGENTQMLIEKLSNDNAESDNQNVELFVDHGRIWTKVSDYSDDSHFLVKTKTAEAHVNKKASFDLTVDEHSTAIQVFDNVVDVVTDTEGHKKTVVAGYEATVDTDKENHVLIAELPSLDDTKIHDTWVAENLVLDKKDDRSRGREIERMFEKGISDTVDVTLTQQDLHNAVVLADSAVETEKQKFLDSYKDLLTAEGYLVRGEHGEGIKYLRKFRHDTSLIIDSLPELEQKDALSASVLRDLIAKTLVTQKQDLALFLPGDKLYAAKKMVLQMELLLADPNTFDRARVQLAQAEGKLLEVQDLLKQKNERYAFACLRDYQELMAMLVIRFPEDQYEQVKGDFVDLMNQQIEQLKVLAAIEKSPYGTYSDEFIAAVSEVRDGTLKRLISSLDPMKDIVSEGDLKNLKDLFDTYLADNSTANDLVSPVLQKALSDESGTLNFIDPANQQVPTEIGFVVVESLEATGDVNVSLETQDVSTEIQPVLGQEEQQITQQMTISEVMGDLGLDNKEL